MIASFISVLIVPLWNWNFAEVGAVAYNILVLIVPLWNWNAFMFCGNLIKAIVLIVPLWNWNDVYICKLKVHRSSNCTFMELKWPSAGAAVMSTPVLIVPLWNWNHHRQPLTLTPSVLIVPLWNWNPAQSPRRAKYAFRSNCTFMELKYWWRVAASNSW